MPYICGQNAGNMTASGQWADTCGISLNLFSTPCLDSHPHGTTIHRKSSLASFAMSWKLVLLYWSIGRYILVRQDKEGWGTKVIKRLAKDLGVEFPETEGFSPRNLKYMRSLAEAWPDYEIVPQLVALLPWGYLRVLLDRVS
jgi:hypothetical protein